MKRLLFILIAAMMPFIGMYAKADKQTVVLSCNLHCQGCCDKIMKNIAFEKGVKDLVCDLKGKTVTVTYDAGKTDVPTLLKAFEKIGKPATVVSAQPPQTSPSSSGSHT
jgi:Cu2+-exporting ATPase